jgi:hypothetical protein
MWMVGCVLPMSPDLSGSDNDGEREKGSSQCLAASGFEEQRRTRRTVVP